jgi:hypothetical protein
MIRHNARGSCLRWGISPNHRLERLRTTSDALSRWTQGRDLKSTLAEYGAGVLPRLSATHSLRCSCAVYTVVTNAPLYSKLNHQTSTRQNVDPFRVCWPLEDRRTLGPACLYSGNLLSFAICNAVVGTCPRLASASSYIMYWSRPIDA